MILICISLMTSGAEQFFMCPLAICISSSEKCLFKSSAHSFIGSFVIVNSISDSLSLAAFKIFRVPQNNIQAS